MCKVIELLNCEYIELKDIHSQQKLKDLYLHHLAIGKQQGYTPVFIDKEISIHKYFFDHYECDCSSEGYQQLKNKILQIANADNYEVWHEKILKKIYLEDEPDENNTKLDFLEFSYDDYNIYPKIKKKRI